jgi:hypothetical protein
MQFVSLLYHVPKLKTLSAHQKQFANHPLFDARRITSYYHPKSQPVDSLGRLELMPMDDFFRSSTKVKEPRPPNHWWRACDGRNGNGQSARQRGSHKSVRESREIQPRAATVIANSF